MSIPTNIYNSSPVWLQNILVSAYGLRWRQRRFGGVFPEAYKQAKQRENLSLQQWQDYQENALQKILLHAYEQSPYYNQSFKNAGLDVSTLKKITPASVHRLPVLSKESLRLYGNNKLLSVKKERNGTFFASSGSTGTPTQILFSQAMHQRWMALFEARVRNWAGVSSFEPRGMIGGRRVLPKATAELPFYRYNYFEKQVYFSAYHITPQNAADYLQGMNKYGIHYMTGYAMSNFLLAGFFKATGVQAPSLKAVITSSEKLTVEMRDIFTEVYHCKTFDGWSGVEACGLITECEQGSLHISPDAGLIEVLDDAMQPAPYHTAGTVYCTGFLNYDQPLIRYNIGDAIILSDKSCSCGRQMPVVKEILGRVEDIITGSDGRQMVRFHSVFNNLPAVKQAQVIQETTSRIIVRIVTDGKAGIKVKQLIRNRIISQLGELDIRIEEVTAIPLNSNGKFQAVISRIKKTGNGLCL